jgi:hypothetical protein
MSQYIEIDDLGQGPLAQPLTDGKKVI